MSISSVSAEILDEGNTMDLNDFNEYDLNGNLNYLNSHDLDSSDNPYSIIDDTLIADGVDDSSVGEGSDVAFGDDDSSVGEVGDVVFGDEGVDNPHINENGDSPGEILDASDDENEIEDTTKNTTLRILSQNNWKIYGVKNYTVKLLDEDLNPVVKAKINFKIKTPKGDYTYKTRYTNYDGIAILTLSLGLRGAYNIEVSYEGYSDYNSAKSVNSNVMVYERSIIRTTTYSFRSCNLAVKLYSTKGYFVPNKRIVISINNVKYYRTTDSKGIAYIRMPSDRRLIKLNCTFLTSDYYEGSQRIMFLPVYKKTYTKPLVYTIFKGRCFRILLKGADGKVLRNEKVNFTLDGKIYRKNTNEKGIAYLKVRLNRGEYKISFAYGNNSVYGPSKNSTILNVIDPSGQYKRGLNQNTKLSVSKYLYGGGRATITKSIRALSRKITGKYSTKIEKATAIFNYVRDNLNYEYYPNSRKGASKTLRTKSGNCCDHANLIVALCRASHIPARYSHAQGCRFVRSGDVEGHVWAQIYVSGRWYSADGTSYRNTLGHVENWDTRSYNRLHIYRNIPF